MRGGRKGTMNKGATCLLPPLNLLPLLPTPLLLLLRAWTID